MATEIYMRRRLNALVPADRGSEEALAKIPQGETVRATVTRPRNVDHHRKWWALLQAVYPHQDTYATINAFHAAIKVALGYGETVKLPDGRAILIPGSISFAAMDQGEFEQFYERAVELILTRILPGVDRPELDAQVMDILDGRGGGTQE